MPSPLISPPSVLYPFPHLSIASSKIKALQASEITAGTSYGLGAKINPLSMQAADPNWPGEVDCSGDFHWLTYHALGMPANFDVPHVTESEPDGSVNQHGWLIANHFKHSTLDSAINERDGFVRVGVLSPSDTSEGIGHIFITIDGMTYESHGGVGVSSRVLADTPILHNAHYFVLAPAENMLD